ncbi:unnamed protein product [Oikopleura dioica]|uniref:Uncharacterized protein n=1 Tax=Oikopleura dioica TaxID=34765 RepID=E4YGQ9_OIKDI|nr:unnamed protein product [Oikopleura dioica]
MAIFLFPKNFKKEIDKLRDSEEENVEAVGCLKTRAKPVRDPASKYFLPKQIYEPETFTHYFSGASYVTTGNLALRMASAIKRTLILPYDDVFVGKLIKNAGQQDFLAGVDDICSGLNPKRIQNDILDDPCLLRKSWPVAHKYSDLEYMKKIFLRTISEECSATDYL